ncbi:MAG: type II toxin-antitoxin system RelE/ParE family toxin [Candidatus Gracilibacteria bacterium]|nr:type II toxin-antitoxin system RelE/ParE family toxin [Candidatus Gracilibacteria bacterium]
MYKIIIEKKVANFLEKHIGENIIISFKERLEILRVDPYSKKLDIKSLIGEKNKYRLRIGKYRFLYKVDNEIITISIYGADSRGSIYK